MQKQHRFCLLIILCITGLIPANGQDRLPYDSILVSKGPGTLACWKETRTVPRPLSIYFLKIAIHDPRLELITLPSIDPDSIGPAEGILTKPVNLLKARHAIAAVNANAFAGAPGSEKSGTGWYEGRFVDIQGLVVANGVVKSKDEEKRVPFWTDKKGIPHIGHPAKNEKVMQAIADWIAPLLINNRVLPNPTDTVLHPRTLIGFNVKKKFILFVVVDGRQKGYSEGMSMYELALLMKEKGCENAINLDGGGSSILLLRDEKGNVQTVNRPSGKTHRPIPVMIGLKEK
jgi:exopolysaccharide biosynthesis protein